MLSGSSIAVNASSGSPLVLECEGRAPVAWSSHTEVSSEREVFTTPIDNAGEQRSWLVYRSATQSDPSISCSTWSGAGCTHYYSVNIFSK